MTLDLAIVHTPVGGGHKAAALAVAEAARARGASVVVIDAFEYAPRLFGRAYLGAHLIGMDSLPELYGIVYSGSNKRDGALAPLQRCIDRIALSGLVKRVLALSPRAVVATHHLPLIALGRARRKGWLGSPLVGVVTDYCTHAVWAETGVDVLCVPCACAFRGAVRHGFAIDRTLLTGIPVSPAFEAIADVRQPPEDKPLAVLVTGGGFGVGPVEAIVRSFVGVGGFELTVVCGRAEELVRRVRAIAAHWGVPARVLGFENDMSARVAAAHVVVGKAGGLTVSEAMTAGRPMILVGAVPGHETINADAVVRAGAGVVAEPKDVAAIVSSMRRQGLMVPMGRRARALVVHSAANRVVDVAVQTARSGRNPLRLAEWFAPPSGHIAGARE